MVTPGSHADPDGGHDLAVGGDQLGLASVRLAQHEGAGQVGAVAIDLGRQVDSASWPRSSGAGLSRPWSMHVSTPKLT